MKKKNGIIIAGLIFVLLFGLVACTRPELPVTTEEITTEPVKNSSTEQESLEEESSE